MNVAAMAARTSPNPHVIPAKAGISRPVSDERIHGNTLAPARSLDSFAEWFVDGTSRFPPSRE